VNVFWKKLLEIHEYIYLKLYVVEGKLFRIPIRKSPLKLKEER